MGRDDWLQFSNPFGSSSIEVFHLFRCLGGFIYCISFKVPRGGRQTNSYGGISKQPSFCQDATNRRLFKTNSFFLHTVGGSFSRKVHSFCKAFFTTLCQLSIQFHFNWDTQRWNSVFVKAMKNRCTLFNLSNPSTSEEKKIPFHWRSINSQYV